MTGTVHEFPDRRAIEKEAGAWLIRLDGDQPLSTAERAALGEWLNRSPIHLQELRSLAAFWGRMNVLTELAVPLGQDQRPKSAPGKAPVLAVAAVVILSCGVFAWTIGDMGQIGITRVQTSRAVYATAVGEHKTVTLADGSVLELNTDSRVRVELGAAARNIQLLQGEAYFAVARDPARPFRVYAGTSRVEAVGTAFSVRLKDQTLDLAVTEGRVAVAVVIPESPTTSKAATTLDSDGAGMGTSREISKTPKTLAVLEHSEKRPLGTVKAGQSATIDANLDDTPEAMVRQSSGATVTVVQSETLKASDMEAEELARRLAWRSGLLIFAGERLEEVVAEISRYSDVNIEIAEPALKDIRIGGQFRVGDVEAMLDALETNFDLRIIRLGTGHVRIAAAHD